MVFQTAALLRQNPAAAVLGFPAQLVAQEVSQFPSQAAIPHLLSAVDHPFPLAAVHPFPLAADLSLFAVYSLLLLPAVLAVL